MSAKDAMAVLIYDGDCPVCSSYVRYVRIRESVGGLLMINARDGGAWIQRVTDAGLDLDEGMVLFYGNRLYHGADCLHTLALLSTSSGVFNRLNAWAFRNALLARVSYPILRAGRNLLLRILRRPKLGIS
jgi:predicted DCC family thiol-disulfide oxidoreductase YuxK